MQMRGQRTTTKKEDNRGGRGTKAQPIEHCVGAVEMHEAAGTHAPQNGHNRASFEKGPCAFDAEVLELCAFPSVPRHPCVVTVHLAQVLEKCARTHVVACAMVM